ncbi:MAG: hypothetical protein LAO30_14780 [Acidobacteriia bacterium]|nr:hypothetical protein [Terriglobia bacterium]
MPTYEAIQREVTITFCFVPKTCWIADVLALSGKKLRVAPNRVDRGVRKYPCPTEKQAAIIEAFHKLEQHELRPHRSYL